MRGSDNSVMCIIRHNVRLRQRNSSLIQQVEFSTNVMPILVEIAKSFHWKKNTIERPSYELILMI